MATDGNKEDNPKSLDFKDPFDELFAIEGSPLSLTANRMVQDFTNTMDSYVLLCKNLYNVLCAANSGFKITISESAFQYYAIILLWERLCQFLPSRITKLSAQFQRRLSCLKSCITGIPKPLEIYLRGIGNFKHPYLGEMRFRLPELLINENFDSTMGTFGKVSAATHFLYEAFPAPGIAALRILADISKTKTFLNDPIWDLPENLRPDIEDPKPMPTSNLLGWSPAKCLTANQMKLFEACGIEENISTNDMRKFFDNSCQLLRKVSEYFTSDDQDPDCSNTESEMETEKNDRFNGLKGFIKVERLPFTGSTIQGLDVRKVSESSEFDRTRMYCDGVISVSSSFMVSDNLLTGAVVAGYRMPREPTYDGKHSWSCYDFNKYEHVPESWISTRNSIYAYNNAEELNRSMWISGSTDKRITQYSFIKKHMMTTEDNWNVYK